jgi:hypothetical protein
MIRFACPTCNRTLQVSEDRAGARAECPGCHGQMTVPFPPPPEPEVVPYAEFREAPTWGPQPAPEPAPPPPAREEYAQPLSDPDLNVRLPRRRKGPEGNWQWRWCSPSMLAFGLLLLPLPFLDVQCSGPGVSVSILNQSGVQIMTGRYSIDPSLDNFNRRVQAQVGLPVNPAQAPFGAGGKDDLQVKSAPLMIVIPFLMLGGIALGLAVRPTVLRVALVGGLVVAAVVLLFVQMAMGFPLQKAVNEAMEREMRRADDQRKALIAQGGAPFGGPGANPFGGPGMNPFGGPGLGANPLVETVYTPWFWLWLVALVGSLGPLVGEMIWAATARTRKRRWRPAYADDY